MKQNVYMRSWAERSRLEEQRRQEISQERIDRLSAMLPDLQKRYPFECLVLFGSTARLKAREASDLDLYAPGLSFREMAQMQLELEFQVIVDILYEEPRPILMDEIRRTGLVLFGEP